MCPPHVKAYAHRLWWMITADKNVFSTLKKEKKKSILKHADPKWGAPSLFKASKHSFTLTKGSGHEASPQKNPLKQWQLNGQSGNAALSAPSNLHSPVYAHRDATANRTKMRSQPADRYCETLCGSAVGVAQSPPPRHLPSESPLDVRFTEVMEHTRSGRSFKWKAHECR